MSDQKIKVWLGLGSFLLIQAGSGPVLAGEHAHPPAMDAHAAAGEGGEGGEGGEAGYVSSDPDQTYAVNLLLMKGHLKASQDLSALGFRENALAHAMHPAAETYGNVAPELEARHAAAFQQELDALVDSLTENVSDRELNAAYDAANQKIDAAMAVIDADKRNSPAFTAALALALLQQAGSEYAIGVEDGVIVNLHEYQDAGGFIAIATELLAGLDQTSPNLTAVMADLSTLKSQINDSAKMQDKVVPAAEILSGVSRIELKLNNIR